MNGFTVICNNCKTQSKCEDGKDRMEENTKILIHDHTTVRLHCGKCGHDIILT